MDNAQLIGLSRQSALRHKLDVVANNLANMNTTGYKTQDLLFEEYLMPVAEASDFERDDRTLSYVLDYRSAYDFVQGAISMTGNALDVAIEGDGWFVVQTPEGESFTRNGAMHLNDQGTLVTADGLPVLGDGGQINFSEDDGAISIAEDGTISTALGQKGRLRVVRFADMDQMQRIGDNLFAAENPLPMTDIRVQQGALERSNVQGVAEMTRMIEVTRNYQTVSKMMSDNDDLMRKAIETLGQVNA